MDTTAMTKMPLKMKIMVFIVLTWMVLLGHYIGEIFAVAFDLEDDQAVTFGMGISLVIGSVLVHLLTRKEG